MNGPILPKSLQDYPQIDDWLIFEGEDKLRLRTGKVEIGQGIATALIQIAADELDIAPERIELISGDTRESPDEGFTAGSMSIQFSGKSIRMAASAARALLLEEAAKLLQADLGDLTIEDGTILNKGQVSDLTYWSLAKNVDLTGPVSDHAAPKPIVARRLIGTSFARTDLPAKIKGEPAFIHDLEFEDMVHGRVLHPPSLSTPLEALDADKLNNDPDILQVVRDGAFVGIISEREDAALRGLAKLERAVTWGQGDGGPEDAVAALSEIKGEEELSEQKGELDSLEGRKFSTTVSRPYLMHGSIGPSCAIAEWQDDKLIIHSHSQGVYQLREGLSQALGVALDDISVIHAQGAGCYGHNGADDAALDAALLARAVLGRKVRVVWSRASELAASPLGPAMVTRVEAVLDENNKITGFTSDVTSQIHGVRPGRGGSPNLLAAEIMENPVPSTWRSDVPLAVGGGADRNAAPYYDIANIRAAKHLVHDLPYRASSLRGLGAFVNVYAIETLMDDIASEIGIDPLAFRLSHLGDPRASECLEKAAKAAAWPGTGSPGKPQEGVGFGIGFARYKNRGTYCAVIARIEVDKEIAVTNIWACADAGEVINPDGIANQVEGGIIQAISWALKEEVYLQDGVVQNRDWESYPILLFDEVPEIALEVIDRPDQPSLGAGECAMGPTSAALGNAVHQALGVRVRALPLTRDKIMAALG